MLKNDDIGELITMANILILSQYFYIIIKMLDCYLCHSVELFIKFSKQYMNSLKNKLRKSCEPSNLSSNTRMRGKFFTGVKRNDLQGYQMQVKGRNINQNTPHELIPSDSVITYEDFSKQQLIRAFYFISQKKQYISPEDLTQLLIDENEEQFKKYEMIRTLDHNGKGYVTKQQFLKFYQESIIANQSQIILPQNFLQRQVWKQAIEQNYELLQKLEDKQYCAYLTAKLQRLKDANVNISTHNK